MVYFVSLSGAVVFPGRFLKQVADVQLPLIHTGFVDAGREVAFNDAQFGFLELTAVAHVDVDSAKLYTASHFIGHDRFGELRIDCRSRILHFVSCVGHDGEYGSGKESDEGDFPAEQYGNLHVLDFNLVEALSSISIVKRWLA